MAVSLTIIVLIIFLHLLAFVFAIGAERRRSEATVQPDEYDDRTFCVYTTDASTVYGLAAFSLLLLSQTVLNAVTRCLCCGKGLVTGCSTTCAAILFTLSWLGFLGAEACLLAGSARNAYHTNTEGILNRMTCLVPHFAKADTGFWEKHQNEGIGLATHNQVPQSEKP
ncbi:hypothetical protein P8452_10784 [Trifolium repens]|nr:hypothetical protein P8452_10784 [Trifolium repens]